MIQPKYEIGDKVYAGYAHYLQKTRTCPDCLGSAEWPVTIPSGEDVVVPCKTCRRGYYSDGKEHYREWAPVVETLHIGSVRIDTADETDPVEYMCEETGVGTGRLYKERELFSTREEAEAAAAKKVADSHETMSKNKHSDVYIHGREKRAFIRLENVIERLLKQLAQTDNPDYKKLKTDADKAVKQSKNVRRHLS